MTLSTAVYKIVAQELKEGIFTATLLNNGIVEVAFNPELSQIEKEHLAMLKDALAKLGNGKKMPIYFNIAPFLNISAEGRSYSASDEAGNYTLANAVLIDSLGKRIGFNFFVNFNKPKTPIKAFSSKEEAFEWLLSIGR